MKSKNSMGIIFFIFSVFTMVSYAQEIDDIDNTPEDKQEDKQEIEIDDNNFIELETITTYMISYEHSLEMSAKLIDETMRCAHLSKEYLSGLQNSSRWRGYFPKLTAEYARNRDNNLNDKNNGDDNLDSRSFSAGLTHDYSISLSFDFRDIPLNQYDVQLAWTSSKIGIARNKLIQEINHKFFSFLKLNRILSSPSLTLSPQKKAQVSFLMMKLRSELDAVSNNTFSKMIETLPQKKIR